MAFAVIETGGKQYRVSPGSIIEIEKLEQEAGASVVFERVLMYQTEAEPVFGAPFITDITISGEIISHAKGEKIRVFTYKPKKRQRRTLGHRQHLTQVKIADFGIPQATAKTKTVKAAA